MKFASKNVRKLKFSLKRAGKRQKSLQKTFKTEETLKIVSKSAKKRVKRQNLLKKHREWKKNCNLFQKLLKKREVHFKKQLEEQGSQKSSPKAMNRQEKEQNWLQNALSRARKSKVAFKSTEKDKFHFRKGGEEMKSQKFSQNELRREGKGQNLLQKAWETVGKEKTLLGNSAAFYPTVTRFSVFPARSPAWGKLIFSLDQLKPSNWSLLSVFSASSSARGTEKPPFWHPDQKPHIHMLTHRNYFINSACLSQRFRFQDVKY